MIELVLFFFVRKELTKLILKIHILYLIFEIYFEMFHQVFAELRELILKIYDLHLIFEIYFLIFCNLENFFDFGKNIFDFDLLCTLMIILEGEAERDE